MLTQEEIATQIKGAVKNKAGRYSYFFGAGVEAHFVEENQTMVAGTYRPVGSLLLQRKVSSIEEVKLFFKDLRKKLNFTVNDLVEEMLEESK